MKNASLFLCSLFLLLLLLFFSPCFVSSIPPPISPPTPFTLSPRFFIPSLAVPFLNGSHSLYSAHFNSDSQLDLLSLDTDSGFISWFRNPTWEKQSILSIHKPIHADIGDVDIDGSVDLILTSNYQGINVDQPYYSSVDWISNPKPGEWTTKNVGQVEMAHQSFIADFAGRGDGSTQIVSVSMASVNGGPAKFVLFEPILTSSSPPSSWDRVDFSPSSSPICHYLYRAEKVPKKSTQKGSNLLLACQEGIILLSINYNVATKQYSLSYFPLFSSSSSNISGVTSLALSTSPFFLAAIDSEPSSTLNPLSPWHGDVISIYYHPDGQDQSIDDLLYNAEKKLERKRIYVNGGGGEGAVVKVADMDGDGCNDIVVGYRGLPFPSSPSSQDKITTGKGLYLFLNLPSSSCTSPSGSTQCTCFSFSQQILSERGSNDFVLVDFDGDGQFDIASVGYSNYDTDSEHALVLYVNEVELKNEKRAVSIGGAVAIAILMFALGAVVMYGLLWHKNKRNRAKANALVGGEYQAV